MPESTENNDPRDTPISAARLETISRELKSRFEKSFLRPYVIPFTKIFFQVVFCATFAFVIAGVPIDEWYIWVFISSFSLLYAGLHLAYSLSEVKTIARVLTLKVSNRPRLPYILLGVGVSLIMLLQILKAKESVDLTKNIYDGLTGITASLVAAALYQILEIWRELREKRDGRQQLLYLLGIDERKFSEDRRNRITIVLPGFRFEEGITSESHRGNIAWNFGARNRLGHGIESLCSAEDVEAFRVITQLFQDREIPWELKYPEEVFGIGDIEKDSYEKVGKFIDTDLDTLPQRFYVSIGLYSNLLTMASNCLEIKYERSFLAFLKPFGFEEGDAPIIVTREDFIQTKTIDMSKEVPNKSGTEAVASKSSKKDLRNKTDLSVTRTECDPQDGFSPSNDQNATDESASQVIEADPAGGKEPDEVPLWKQLLGDRKDIAKAVDSCFIFRRPIKNGTIFIFGGLTAPGTKACSYYLQEHWQDLISDIEIDCRKKNRVPSVAKFVRIFYADVKNTRRTEEFSFNHGYIDVN